MLQTHLLAGLEKQCESRYIAKPLRSQDPSVRPGASWSFSRCFRSFASSFWNSAASFSGALERLELDAFDLLAEKMTSPSELLPACNSRSKSSARVSRPSLLACSSLEMLCCCPTDPVCSTPPCGELAMCFDSSSRSAVRGSCFTCIHDEGLDAGAVLVLSGNVQYLISCDGLPADWTPSQRLSIDSAFPVAVLADAQTSTMRTNAKDMAAVVMPWDQHLQAEWPRTSSVLVWYICCNTTCLDEVYKTNIGTGKSCVDCTGALGDSCKRLEWLQHAVCGDLTRRS